MVLFSSLKCPTFSSFMDNLVRLLKNNEVVWSPHKKYIDECNVYGGTFLIFIGCILIERDNSETKLKSDDKKTASTNIDFTLQFFFNFFSNLSFPQAKCKYQIKTYCVIFLFLENALSCAYI